MKIGQIAKIAAGALLLIAVIGFFLSWFGGIATGLNFAFDAGEFLVMVVFILAILGAVYALLSAFGIVKLQGKIGEIILVAVAALTFVLFFVWLLTIPGGFDMLGYMDFGFWLTFVGTLLATVAGVVALLKAE